MKKLIVLFSVLFLTTCANQTVKPNIKSYDNICPFQDLLIQATDSVYRTHTVMTFKSNDDSEGRQEERNGLAFTINKRQLLTVEHLVSIDDYFVSTPYGTMTIFISQEDKAKEETWILQDNISRIPAKVIYRNKELDFAVLEVENDMALPIYSIGDSDDFHILDHVFIVTNVGMGVGIKSGHIMQLDFIKYVELQVKERDVHRFGLCLAIKMGDSGGPVLLIRDGKIEIGGLITLGDLEGTGYGIKINSIMNKFRSWQNERQW